MDYSEFLAGKSRRAASVAVEVAPVDLHPSLFGWQRDLVCWAARKGRAALFADTGLGKTRMQVEWARLVADTSLIVAPLSVAAQTVPEAIGIGVYARHARDQSQVDGPGVWVTSYEMADRFDPSAFGAVVLDESSILKATDGKTRARLTAAFAGVPMRLACTATPAPNDVAELSNHAEFLGVCSRAEMLAAWFVHDDQGWRLKGHAREAFYRWLASWAMSLRRPSDLGYSDEGYDLPPLSIVPQIVSGDWGEGGTLLGPTLGGVTGRARMRRLTLDARVARAATLVGSVPVDPWIVWCGLNDEAEMVTTAIAEHGSVVNVTGSMSPDAKAGALQAFRRGDFRHLVTKPSIAGFGMNFQHCHQMAFLGLGDSFESYYQCIRRSYRYGQHMPVTAHVVLSDVEEPIFHNVLRKEAEARSTAAGLVRHTAAYEREELCMDAQVSEDYESGEATGDGWRLLLGDACERLAEIPDGSVGLSVHSPPFASLFTYSPTDRDLGNCADRAQFLDHYGYVIDELLRTTMPGRNAAVHVQQLTTTKATHGVIGLTDFRGDVIRAYTSRGWTFHGEVAIRKDPQAQAIRTHAKALLFVQLRKDSSWSRPALADYVLIFRAPGENPVPVCPDLTNDEWIDWASPIWDGIEESDTLNAAVAREHADERHICPLQLGVIERCVRLWSNAGETVLSPFAGIGSEGYEAVRLGRRFVGIELKPSYWRVAVRNLRRAESDATSLTLFDLMAEAG